jgi:hypothetical protein
MASLSVYNGTPVDTVTAIDISQGGQTVQSGQSLNIKGGQTSAQYPLEPGNYTVEVALRTPDGKTYTETVHVTIEEKDYVLPIYLPPPVAGQIPLPPILIGPGNKIA